MDQRLILHYNNELRFIREMGNEFAAHFPKVAGRLGIEGLECADPYVERLLESFAFLSARVQLKMEEEFPKLCQHLLEIVYPDYLAPVPSMAVVQMSPEKDDAGLAEGFVLPRGSSMRSGIGTDMQTACEYRTAHEVTLYPLQVTDAAYIGTRAGLAKLGVKPGRRVVSGMKITLSTTAGVALNELNLDELPFFLAGSGTLPMALYEHLHGSVCGVAMAVGTGASKSVRDLGSDALQPLGFAPEQALLNYRSRSFDGYRLLREYFTFPDRFRFVNFTGLRPLLKTSDANSFDIIIYFDRRQNELENVVDETNFLLYCTPVANLFPKRTDRVRLNDRDEQFHIVPDRSRPSDFEIHQVLEVTGFGTEATDKRKFLPFYALKDRHQPSADAAFYTIQRRARVLSSRQRKKGARSNYLGQELFISLVDANEAPYPIDIQQLGVKVMCTNRDLPLRMPLGQKEGDFFLDLNAPVTRLKAVAGPTRPASMGLVGETRNRAASTTSGDLAWRLINHLSLNFLSLVDESPEEGASALREILELYTNGHPLSERQINGVISVRANPVTRRLLIPGPISFGRGLEIVVTLEESAFEAGGMYLMGAVISEFFRKYVSVNHVTETVVRTDSDLEIGRWPVKMGRRPEL